MNEMEKLYRGPYIDAYCQVWFHLAKLFQRRRLKYEKVEIDVECKLKTCSACQDLHALQF
jgi:hypothetical protein